MLQHHPKQHFNKRAGALLGNVPFPSNLDVKPIWCQISTSFSILHPCRTPTCCTQRCPQDWMHQRG